MKRRPKHRYWKGEPNDEMLRTLLARTDQMRTLFWVMEGISESKWLHYGE